MKRPHHGSSDPIVRFPRSLASLGNCLSISVSLGDQNEKNYKVLHFRSKANA